MNSLTFSRFVRACRDNRLQDVRSYIDNNDNITNYIEEGSHNFNKVHDESECIKNKIKLADLNKRDSDDKTVLYYAISNKSFEMVKLLIKHGSDINKSSLFVQRRENAINEYLRFDEPPIVTSVRTNLYQVTEYLLAMGCNVNDPSIILDDHQLERDRKNDIVPENRLSANMKQSSNNCLNDCFNCFMECSSTTSLHYAVKNGNIKLVEKLLRHGAEVNSIDYEGSTPLHVIAACRREKEFCKIQKEIMCILIKCGAKTSVHDRKSFTPLLKAVMHGCLYSVESILKYRNKNEKQFEKNSCTSLNIAVFQNRKDIALELINYDFKLDSVDSKFLTPLQSNIIHHASSSLASLLIYFGCDVNCYNRPFHTASLMHFVLNNPRLDCENLSILMLRAGYNLNQDVWLIDEENKKWNESRELDAFSRGAINYSAIASNFECNDNIISSYNNEEVLKIVNRKMYFTEKTLERFELNNINQVHEGRLGKLKLFLHYHLRNPKSLTDACRNVIRLQIYKCNGGTNIIKYIDSIHVPLPLNKFLKLNDVGNFDGKLFVYHPNLYANKRTCGN